MKLYWVALVPLLAACNILNNETAPNGTRTITLYNYFFYPASDTLDALEGDTISVTFVWSTNTFNHSVTWDSPPIPLRDSDVQSIGEMDVSLVPGEFDYHCSVHQVSDNMVGKIIVKPHEMM